MDFLRNLLGSLTSGIIRLLVGVGIVAAIGYFIVKPALDTTNRAIEGVNRGLRDSLGPRGAHATGIDAAIEHANRQLRHQVRKSLKAARHEGNPRRLVRCVKHARGDVQKIQQCTVKF